MMICEWTSNELMLPNGAVDMLGLLSFFDFLALDAYATRRLELDAEFARIGVRNKYS